ncbi:MAG: indole-3-glycerol phosphate synthase TrpC [Candidatus Methanoplasma sp.]|jgi:indole-3-glycerol phosphate synthase|nr:indole-3-glycerol phosphate synthase TrpC [Candidatus Methanoplasma sp.]
MILDEIAGRARARAREDASSEDALREEARRAPRPPSFSEAIGKRGLSFICEAKRASPSKGVICEGYDPAEIARGYEAAGADAISVLTEPEFFLGGMGHLSEASRATGLPLLMKDFAVDARQILRGRAAGASAALLICSILDDRELESLLREARGLGMSALVEARDEAEIERALAAGAGIVGVNNRDLRTFEVDLGASLRLRDRVPDGVLFVSESGISSRRDVEALEAAGADAALVGESMMRARDKKAHLDMLRGSA